MCTLHNSKLVPMATMDPTETMDHIIYNELMNPMSTLGSVYNYTLEQMDLNENCPKDVLRAR